jgi:hypothetical protein
MNAPARQYQDPIARMSLNRSGVPKVDLLNGESREIGETYHFAGWFKMNDQRKVKILRELAEGYGSDPQMRWHTAKFVESAGCAPRDFAAQAAAIHAYAQNGCYYTNEPGEQIQSPWRTMSVRTGDCDDLALLIASMAHSIGLPWKYALAGKMPNGNMVRWREGEKWPYGADMFHIYVYLGWPPFEPSQWAAAEPTIRGIPFGYDVVDRGLPGQAAQSVDLGGGGQVKRSKVVGSIGAMGRIGLGDSAAALVSPTALFNNVQNATPVNQGPPVSVPVAPGYVFTDKLKTAYSYIDWKDLTNALVQGVIIAVAVPVAVQMINRQRKKR